MLRIREGDSCYVLAAPDDPMSDLLRHVDCQDFTPIPNEEPVTEARVVLQPPRAEFRHVVVSGTWSLSNCVCGEPNPHNERGTFFRTCDVSSLEDEDDFRVGPSEMCSNQIGLEFKGLCNWQSDHSVRVERTYNFFEDSAGSCGGGDLEVVFEHTSSIPADTTECFHQDDNDAVGTTCVSGFTCFDRFDVDFCIENQVAP